MSSISVTLRVQAFSDTGEVLEDFTKTGSFTYTQESHYQWPENGAGGAFVGDIATIPSPAPDRCLFVVNKSQAKELGWGGPINGGGAILQPATFSMLSDIKSAFFASSSGFCAIGDVFATGLTGGGEIYCWGDT